MERVWFLLSKNSLLNIQKYPVLYLQLYLSPVQKLFSPSRWDDLISMFRQENFSLYQLSSQSVLSVTLQAGLSALKTPYP